jgi:hypothetical protein
VAELHIAHCHHPSMASMGNALSAVAIAVQRARYRARAKRGKLTGQGGSMDEIVKAVMGKTGLSEGHARMAVETVLTFVKSKLPAPLASQVDGFLQGGAAGGAGGLDLGGLGGALGGMFKKE